MTIWLELIVTNRCNLRCRHCYFASQLGETDMDLDMIESLVNQFVQIKQTDVHELILAGGEPTLHSKIRDIVQIVHNAGLPVLMATNGYKVSDIIDLLVPSDGIQVSLDGCKKVHDKYRGVNSYEVAIGALELLQKRHIGRYVMCTVHKGNTVCFNHVKDMAAKYTGRFPNTSYLTSVPGVEQISMGEFMNGYTASGRVPCNLGRCVGGTQGMAVNVDGTYWVCPRSRVEIGKFPDSLAGVISWSDPKELKKCLVG